MFVIIVGGGKTGSTLAKLLLASGHTVRVVESRPEVLEKLKKELPTEAVLRGDGADPRVLIRAGIHAAEVVAAATGDDEDNLVVCMLARFEFGVRRVVGRVNNPKNAWLYNADMGVDVAIDQPDLMAKLIVEEMSLGDMMLLLKLRRGDYTLVEEKLSPGSQALGVAIRDMGLPETCVIAAVIRQGKVLTPRGQMQFEAGDEVLAVVDNASLAILRQFLAPKA